MPNGLLTKDEILKAINREAEDIIILTDNPKICKCAENQMVLTETLREKLKEEENG